MLIKLIKFLSCLIAATAAFNAQADFTADLELGKTDYAWLEFNDGTGVIYMPVKQQLTHKTNTIYEYEYTSKELADELSHALWLGSNEWSIINPQIEINTITTSDDNNGAGTKSPLPMKVFLFIISGFIGIFCLTKDRSSF